MLYGYTAILDDGKPRFSGFVSSGVIRDAELHPDDTSTCGDRFVHNWRNVGRLSEDDHDLDVLPYFFGDGRERWPALHAQDCIDCWIDRVELITGLEQVTGNSVAWTMRFVRYADDSDVPVGSENRSDIHECMRRAESGLAAFRENTGLDGD